MRMLHLHFTEIWIWHLFDLSRCIYFASMCVLFSLFIHSFRFQSDIVMNLKMRALLMAANPKPKRKKHFYPMNIINDTNLNLSFLCTLFFFSFFICADVLQWTSLNWNFSEMMSLFQMSARLITILEIIK